MCLQVVICTAQNLESDTRKGDSKEGIFEHITKTKWPQVLPQYTHQLSVILGDFIV